MAQRDVNPSRKLTEARTKLAGVEARKAVVRGSLLEAEYALSLIADQPYHEDLGWRTRKVQRLEVELVDLHEREKLLERAIAKQGRALDRFRARHGTA